ncbi:MAG: DUF3857 domain-containing protein [Thermoanaerobaculales bacterium]|nr:DUF3857 domain-containing protein [Thermoanaerobaculales bacterium]
MSRRRKLVGALIVFSCAAGFSSADWWDVQVADVQLDLFRARQEALDTLETGSSEADALAVAGWWYENLDNLFDPGEILRVGLGKGGAELNFHLGRIAAELQATPPPGALNEVELSGPWGVFGRLDLERDELPLDQDIPPLGTPWRGPGSQYNYRIQTEDGWIGVPPSLQMGGVTVAGWTLLAPDDIEGWLVVEAEGSLRLEVDGFPIDQVPFAGVEGPEILWYRIRWAAGPHRIRLAFAPAETAAARLTLFDAESRPLSLDNTAPSPGPWAPSSTVAGEPTPPEEPGKSVDDVQGLLRAAELANLRGHTARQRQYLETALAAAPDESMVQLAVAAFFLLESTGAAPEVDFRRTRDHLRKCSGLPITPLVEHLLALRQGRTEDVERLKEELTTGESKDPRILQLKLVQAIHRGWVHEAETTLSALESRLGDTEALVRWRLDVLGRLEQWNARRATLLRLAEAAPSRRRNVTLLATACCTDLAVDLVHQLRTRVVDPDLDADLVRLLIRADRTREAQAELAAALDRWGRLPALGALRLVLAEGDAEDFASALKQAIALRPHDLDLRSLAWRRGILEPFWAGFQVDALEFAGQATTSEEGVDSVLLLDQAVERVFDDGSSLYYYHGLAKALTPAGARRAATLEQMPDAQRLTLRIIKADGTVVFPADIKTDGANVVLGEVEPGDLVEEEYVAAVPSSAPGIRGHLSPYIYRFSDSTRVFGLSEYVIVAPVGLDLQVDGLFAGLEYSENTDGGLRMLHWRAEDVPAIPNEPFAPPTQELQPWVTYSFRMSWQDVGDLLRERLLASLRTSKELDEFAAHYLDHDQEDPVGALRSLVGAVIDRVEPGPTLLDLGTTAGEAFSRGRGNRLGIVAGALRSAGRPVDLVLSRPTPFVGTHLDVPSMDVFGIPLLRVEHEGREIWIDLKQAQTGVDYLSPSLQGSDGLALPLGDPRASVYLVSELPSFPNPQLVERSALEVKLDADGGARLSFHMWLLDAQASRFAENLGVLPEDKIDLVFRRLANSSFPGAEGVVGTIEKEDSSLEVSLDFRLSAACDPEDETMSCAALAASSPIAPILATLPKRRFPLILQQPILRRFERELLPPPGWEAPTAAPRHLDSRWGSVHESLTTKGPSLHSCLVLEVHAARIEPEDYPEFARFCRAVDELVGRPPILTRLSSTRGQR